MALICNSNAVFKRLITSNMCNPGGIVRNSLSVCLFKRSMSSKRLSDTSIIIQSGTDIQELPLVVKKLSGIEAGHVLFCEDVSDGHTVSPSNKVENSDAIPRQDEINEIIVGFNNCNTLSEVLKLLNILPSNYVEPAVAFQIIKKMFELDTKDSLSRERMGEDVATNFTTTAVFNQLIDVVLSKNDCSTLINVLKLTNQCSFFRKYFEPYWDKLIEKIFICVTKNMFSIPELCDIVEEFHKCGNVKNIDNIWIGIAENSESVNHDNVMLVFRVLPHFNASRNMVVQILVEKLTNLWSHIKENDIIELLAIVRNTPIQSQQLMRILARWLNTKIHSIGEEDLESIVNGFGSVNFVNSQIIAALERYMKMRANLISRPTLVAAVMDYCDQFRIRSPLILEKASDYFISYGKSLAPPVLKSLIVPFGNLNFSPTRSYEFWKMFEHVIEDKFTQFKPDSIVDIMLSCILLEKYPINFVNYIFNPYFLTRLQSSSENWLIARNKLALFDHMMSLNFPSYNGPLLPVKFPSATLFLEKQLRALQCKMKRALKFEYKDRYHVEDMKILRSCPINHRCIIDIFMEPILVASKQPALAILINLPEDYTYDGSSLTGVQQMRIRHFADNMGFKVINLNYLETATHCQNDKELLKYLKEFIDAEVYHDK